MCRPGTSDPIAPATTPHASAGSSRRACATIAFKISASMVSTRSAYPAVSAQPDRVRGRVAQYGTARLAGRAASVTSGVDQMRGRLGVAFVTALLAGAVGLPGPAHAALTAKPVPDPLAKATATVAPAVMFVEVRWKGQVRDRATGQVYADSNLALSIRCSGFGVSSDGYLVTAGRC